MKFQDELKGVDFESDYLALYTETKEVMAAFCRGEFWPSTAGRNERWS